MSNFCSSASRILLVFIGFIFWAAAAGLFFIGGWVVTTYRHFDEFTTAHLTLIPAAIILAVGLLMFIIGLVGFIAAFNTNKCLLSIFFCLVIIILVLEVAAAAFGYAYKGKIKGAVSDGLTDALDKYNETVYKDQFDYLQEQVMCCGVSNASDWMHSPTWVGRLNGTVPRSCCIGGPENKNCTAKLYNDDKIYRTGCLPELQDKFRSNLVYIAGVAIAFCVIQILGLITSCILICRSKEVKYHTLQSGGGLRV